MQRKITVFISLVVTCFLIIILYVFSIRVYGTSLNVSTLIINAAAKFRLTSATDNVTERLNISAVNVSATSPAERKTMETLILRDSFPPLRHPVLPSGVNCTRVWQGDVSEVARAKNLAPSAAVRPPGFYQNITRGCAEYRRVAGYIEEVSEEERGFPLAFSVLVYKDVEQVERLLRAVYRPHNIYCIHTDAKASPQVKNKINALVSCLPNVFKAPREVDVRWGTFTVLEPELICMEASLRKSKSWRYFINLTGQEFPLKTNRELVAILKEYRGANDIYGRYVKENAFRWSEAGRPPHNISVAKGAVHLCASRAFVDFAVHSPFARDFLGWINRTKIPDESFFTTLNNQHQLGAPGAYTGDLNSSQRMTVNRFKLWASVHVKCDGQFVRGVCNFGEADVHRMIASVFMFANKFRYGFHPPAYDCLEQRYFSRVDHELATGKTDLNLEFYKNLEIVKHALRLNTTEER